MSSDWEEVKDDEREKVKDFKKFKGKMMERNLIEGFKNILNPKMDKYGYGYELDDEENEKKEESLDEHINAFFEKLMNNKGSCGH